MAAPSGESPFLWSYSFIHRHLVKYSFIEQKKAIERNNKYILKQTSAFDCLAITSLWFSLLFHLDIIAYVFVFFFPSPFLYLSHILWISLFLRCTFSVSSFFIISLHVCEFESKHNLEHHCFVSNFEFKRYHTTSTQKVNVNSTMKNSLTPNCLFCYFQSLTLTLLFF